MKTSFKLFVALLLIIGLGSCEKDPIEPNDPELLYAADAKSNQNFNNGMINQYSSETVLLWNELLSATIDNRMPQPVEVKHYAMVSLAVHDALNNVLPKYETYALDNLETDVSGISQKNLKSIADAAVSQAARNMMVSLIPSATAAADARLDLVLSGIEDSQLKSRGVEIGAQAAEAVLAKRAGDFPLRFESYQGGTQPGEYQANYMPYMQANAIWPNNAVFSFNLGQLPPFGILSGDQFRDEAPNPLNSPEYIADYNEVKALGCKDCIDRTEEQTEIGAFWIESNASSMSRLARTLIKDRKLDGWEAARLIALLEMSIMDAYIASFEGKAYFKFWRPVSAIRAGDNDGVDATVGDPSWISSFFTPPTAEFPSTHAYAGGAAAAIFKSYFKTDHIRVIVTSPYYWPSGERELHSFSQMSYENAISRIYIGYHFRQAVEVGERQGKELGEYIFQNNLRELKRNL